MAPVSWPSLQVASPSAANAAGKVAVVEGCGGSMREAHQCSTQFISTCCSHPSPDSEQGLGRISKCSDPGPHLFSLGGLWKKWKKTPGRVDNSRAHQFAQSTCRVRYLSLCEE